MLFADIEAHMVGDFLTNGEVVSGAVLVHLSLRTTVLVDLLTTLSTTTLDYVPARKWRRKKKITGSVKGDSSGRGYSSAEKRAQQRTHGAENTEQKPHTEKTR